MLKEKTQMTNIFGENEIFFSVYVSIHAYSLSSSACKITNKSPMTCISVQEFQL